MNKIIIFDALIGAILLGTFSYVTNLYRGSSDYLKILAYLWAAPATYFYILYIASRNNKSAMNDLSKHALLGHFMTSLAILITLYYMDMNTKYIIIGNLVYTFAVFFIYFYFKLYKLNI